MCGADCPNKDKHTTTACGICGVKIEETKPTTYAITKATATNGSFTVKVGEAEVTTAAENATVTITATADTGYEVDKVTVTETENTSATVSVGADNTFTMPAKAVTVTVTFKAVQTPPEETQT